MGLRLLQDFASAWSPLAYTIPMERVRIDFDRTTQPSSRIFRLMVSVLPHARCLSQSLDKKRESMPAYKVTNDHTI